MIIVDTNCLIALHKPSEPTHNIVVDAIKNAKEQLIISPYVMAEFDYLISQLGSVEHEVQALRNVLASVFVHTDFSREDISRCCDVIAKYSALNIGLTDASLLVLADRYQTNRIMTLNRRHFGAMKGLNGKALKLLPDTK